MDMNRLKFATMESCFPVWGRFAVEMAGEAGFQGLQITDGGGYLQPHPLNNGFVEYERFGLDLRRKDSFPLLDRRVQEDYLEAAEASGIQLTGIFLHLLDHQGFMKFADRTPQGQQCLETIRNAVVAAAQMKIPQVSVPARGLFGAGQHAYALDKLRYAAKAGEEYGVRIAAAMDTGPERQLEVLERLDGKVTLDYGVLDPVLSACGGAVENLRALKKEHIAQIRLQDLRADSEGFLAKAAGCPALLGRGDGGLQDCAEAILETGFEGWILSETPYYSAALAEDGEDFLSLAKRDMGTLKRMFRQEEGRD